MLKTSGKRRWSKSMSLAEVASISPRRVESDPDVAATSVAGVMAEIGARARAAARILALAPRAQKDAARAAMARALRDRRGDILAANAEDVAAAKAKGENAAFIDRLALDDKRITAMADSLDVVRALRDPIGAV